MLSLGWSSCFSFLVLVSDTFKKAHDDYFVNSFLHHYMRHYLQALLFIHKLDKHMKKISSIILVLSILLYLPTSFAFAQSPNEMELGLSRDFGYSGFNNDIQGFFTLKIKDPPENLVRVIFLIDSTIMGEDTQAPFSLQFNTDSYPLGNHKLNAHGYTTEGDELNSNVIQVQFMPAGSGMDSVVKIVVPIVGLIILIGLIAVFLPL